jgi:methionyl-tRNA formyltransferase
MKIIFAGTPDIAVPSLEALSAVSEVAAVLTAPDRISGRGRKITPSAVKVKALELGIPVLQPETTGSKARELIAETGADLLVAFAYGRIFGPKFLALFPRGGINMHPSALPLYRGPSPITAAILAGDTQISLTVQKIALEMDAGDIISQTPFPLDGRETTASLTASVALAAAPELAAAVKKISAGDTEAVPQDSSKATYCPVIRREDGLMDWSKPAVQIERMVRAYIPWPKARTTMKSDTLAILESSVYRENESGSGEQSVPGRVLGVDKSRGILIQTGNGILAVTRLQLASRKPLDFRSFLNGVELEQGITLGEHT